MLVRLSVMCGALMGVAMMLVSAPAAAQNPCAPDDLQCRVAALEARLAVLETKPAPLALAAPAAPLSPTQEIDLWVQCRSNCVAEAAEQCVEKGFAGGRVKTFDRPRTGPTMLKRAVCERS